MFSDLEKLLAFIRAPVPCSGHAVLGTAAFAALWTGDAHWAAVEALDAKRRTG